MEDTKKLIFSVKMLAAYMKVSVPDLAKNAGIDVYHLQQVSYGRVKLSTDDLVKLHNYTGIDVNNIEI